MFKADNLKEAVKVKSAYDTVKEQLEQLDKETFLEVNFGARSVSLKEGDPKYSEVKNAMRVFLQLRIDNCKRRAAQLDFQLESTVYPKIERTVSAPNLVHSLDAKIVNGMNEDMEALFGKAFISPNG